MASVIEEEEACLNARLQHSPDFSNLEIRGTWSGDELDPVNLRLSLEVQCTPNTELQLLNIRSTSISLVKTFFVRLRSGEQGQEDCSNESFPPSPLFAFSTPISDDGDKNPSSFSAGVPAEGSNTAAKESSAASSKETTPSTEMSMKPFGGSELGPSLLSFTPPKSSSAMQLNVARCADWIKMQSLGKRSASEACLTDSDSESAKNKTPNMNPSGKSAVRQYSSTEPGPESDDGSIQPPCKTLERGAASPSGQSPTRASYGRHPRKHSMIPKRVTRLHNNGGKQANPSSTPRPTSSIMHDKQLSEDGDFPTPTKPIMVQLFYENKEAHGSLSTTTTVTTSNSSEVVDSVITELTNLTKSGSAEDSSQSSLGLSALLDGLLIDLEPDQQPTTNASKHMESETAIPPLHEDAIVPQTPASKTGVILAATENGYKHHSACGCEYCSSLIGEPQIDIDGGIIFIRNPSNVISAAYKFAITLSIVLESGKTKGWNELVIPGLPRMRASESAFFLFLIPENHGLEFRTTNLQRYKIVENCFCAEFVNQRDLVVPLRICDRKFYGIVKDFTVDQEIRAEYTVVANKEGEEKGTQSDVVVNYAAMCSLRLHNRSFWAEKCCFFLRLDGGPEGCFRCQLESRNADLQMIRLQAKDEEIGVSHIQVICSPRDLEMFGIAWKVKPPGHQAMNWLPRMYPISSTSYESNKKYLRQIFTDLEAGFRRKIGHEPVRITDMDDGYNNACGAEHSAEKQSTEDDYNCLVHPAELPLKAEQKPSDGVDYSSMEMPITGSVAKLLTLWKRYLITIFCVAVTWRLTSVLLYAPTHSSLFNSTWNRTDLNVSLPLPPETLYTFGADLSHGEMGLGPIPSKRDDLIDDTAGNKLSEYPAHGSKTDISQNVNHAEAEDVQKISERTDTSEEASSLVSNSPENQPIFSFRDRIDYWLGWKGPIPNEMRSTG